MSNYRIRKINAEEYRICKLDGTEYRIRVKKGRISCSCLGYQFSGHCKHCDLIVQKIGNNSSGRIPRNEARCILQPFLKVLSQAWEQYEIAGSYRRGRKDVKDIDIVVIGDFVATIEIINRFGISVEVGKHGKKKNILNFTIGYLPVNLLFTSLESWGAALCHFTGPVELNIAMRKIAKNKGWLLNRYGLWDIQGRQIAGATERSIYDMLKIPYQIPEQREQFRKL